jgi:hypothetical protein
VGNNSVFVDQVPHKACKVPAVGLKEKPAKIYNTEKQVIAAKRW